MPALVLLLSLNAAPCFAQNSPPEALGHFGQWQTYRFQENGQPVCYMVTSKVFPGSKKFRRGTAYLMITHRPQENALDVVSYSPGYIFAPKHDVKLSLGAASFNLFADKDSAWTRNAHTDHALVSAMRNAKSLTILGVPVDKNVPAQRDILTITGITAAYRTIGKACGLDVPQPAKASSKSRKKAF